MRTVAEKMGIKDGVKSYMLHAPEGISKTITLPSVELSTRLAGSFDYIHFFAKNQADLRKNFSKLRNHLKEKGMLWVSWLKGKKGTDLTLTKVIEIGYDNGLVESIVLKVDDDWAGMKFTWPKAGKVYKNSYGKLK